MKFPGVFKGCFARSQKRLHAILSISTGSPTVVEDVLERTSGVLCSVSLKQRRASPFT